MVDVPLFLVMEEKLEVVQITPRCFSERIIEQIVNVPVPQKFGVVSLTKATADRRAFVDVSFHGLWRLRLL